MGLSRIECFVYASPDTEKKFGEKEIARHLDEVDFNVRRYLEAAGFDLVLIFTWS